MIWLGITATRKGLTPIQYHMARAVMTGLGLDGIRHGDCIGGDEQMHGLATRFGLKTFVHPPDNDVVRAFCKGTWDAEPKPYLTRNRDIIKGSTVLLALPLLSSKGTFWTWHQAAEHKVPSIMIGPEGEYVVRDWNTGTHPADLFGTLPDCN